MHGDPDAHNPEPIRTGPRFKYRHTKNRRLRAGGYVQRRLTPYEAHTGFLLRPLPALEFRDDAD